MHDSSHDAQRQQMQTARRGAFGVAVAVQVVIVLVVVFGDIGFDRPGRFGLDFGDLIGLTLLWLAATGSGFLLAWGVWRSWQFGLQCFVFGLTVCGGLLVACWPVSAKPTPPDAQKAAPEGR